MFIILIIIIIIIIIIMWALMSEITEEIQWNGWKLSFPSTPLSFGAPSLGNIRISLTLLENKKAELSQRWPHDVPIIYGCPKNFRES